jgi:hypothetical protein
VTGVSSLMKRLIWSPVVVGTFLIASVEMTGGQTLIHGAVVNRDGQPQAQCKVEFRTSPNSEPEQVVYTDASGQFALTNPQYTTYSVLVRQGGRTYQIDRVVVTPSGITPNPLVVDW